MIPNMGHMLPQLGIWMFKEEIWKWILMANFN